MKIDFLLQDSKEQLEKLKKDIKKGSKVKKDWIDKQNDLEMLDKLSNIISGPIKMIFLEDRHYEEGSVKVVKCVKNAFKEVKYRKKLYEYLKTKNQKQSDSLEDAMNFQCYEGLLQDLDVLEDIFDVISKSLPVIKEDIEKGTCASISLLASIITLISRLSQLYNIYGYYLEDLGGLNEYTINCIMFQSILKLSEDIFKKLKGDDINE